MIHVQKHSSTISPYVCSTPTILRTEYSEYIRYSCPLLRTPCSIGPSSRSLSRRFLFVERILSQHRMRFTPAVCGCLPPGSLSLVTTVSTRFLSSDLSPLLFSILYTQYSVVIVWIPLLAVQGADYCFPWRYVLYYHSRGVSPCHSSSLAAPASRLVIHRISHIARKISAPPQQPLAFLDDDNNSDLSLSLSLSLSLVSCFSLVMS